MIKKKILVFITFLFLILHAEDKQFVIISPTYNNNVIIGGVPLYQLNIESVVCQQYPHWRMVIIDDCSDDKTAQNIEQYITKHHLSKKITLIKNKTRRGALHNRYIAAHDAADTEILIMLDGDDLLAHEQVLNYLNNIYQDPNIWMTYGQFQTWCERCFDEKKRAIIKEKHRKCRHTKGSQFAKDFPQLVKEKSMWREYITNNVEPNCIWHFGHLRTHYARLFKLIKPEDLKHHNKFYKRGTDIATTIPIAEMAGVHVKFIPDILCLWNRSININGNKNTLRTPSFYPKDAIKKPKHQPLHTLFD